MEAPHSNPISMRQLMRHLKKLHVQNGDVLALKYESENANKDAIDAITRAFTEMQMNVLVIVVNDFDDLSVLNETEMAKRGWFHMRKISSLRKPGGAEND